MELYIIENYKDIYPDLKGSGLTDELIRDCLEEYGMEKPQVLRASKGKPYVNFGGKEKVHLSVSHSGSFFVCIIADKPVGIDLQEERKVSSEKIAKRYFSDKERQYMDEHGDKGFYILWTRKEAYSKLTGDGLAEVIRGIDVLDRDDVEFTDFQLGDGLWCSYCIGGI